MNYFVKFVKDVDQIFLNENEELITETPEEINERIELIHNYFFQKKLENIETILIICSCRSFLCFDIVSIRRRHFWTMVKQWTMCPVETNLFLEQIFSRFSMNFLCRFCFR